MAIPLTPKQRKAEFSAFDTNSRFTSGLEGVSDALSSVSRTAATFATSLKDKHKKAQKNLARDADANRSVELAEKRQVYNDALAGSDTEAIKNARKELEAISSRPLPSFQSENAGGVLDDEEAIAFYDSAFKKANASFYAGLESKQDQAILISDANKKSDEYQLQAVRTINMNPQGAPIEGFQSILYNPHIIDEENGIRGISEGLTQTGADTYVKGNRGIMLGFIVEDLENTKDPELLKQKRELARDFIQNNTYMKFDVSDMGKIDDEYKKAIEAAGNISGLIDEFEEQISTLVVDTEAFISTSSKNPTEALEKQVLAQELLTEAEKVLPKDNAKLKRLKAMAGLTTLFAPKTETLENGDVRVLINEPTEADLMVEQLLLLPEDVSVMDAFNEVAGDASNFDLDSSALSKLRDWLSTTKTDITNEIRDGNASFIRRLSFADKMLYDKAQGGSELARAQLEQRYAKLRKQRPTIFGLSIPSVVHIPLKDPLPEVFEKDALVERMNNEVNQNTTFSTNVYAASQINQGRASVREQAYYQLLWANTSLINRAQAGEAVNFNALEYGALALQLSEQATSEDREILKRMTDERATSLTVAAEGVKLSADPNFSAALNLFTLGLIVDSDEKDYDSVLEHVKLQEKTYLNPLFGYTGTTNSSANVSVPPVVAEKYVDPTLDDYGYFERALRFIKKSFNNSLSGQEAVDAYATAVAVLSAYNFDIDRASDLKGIIANYGDLEGEIYLGAGFSSYPVANVEPPEKTEQQLFNEKRAFMGALARGVLNNTRKEGNQDRPTARIGHPTWQRTADGKGIEQVVALEAMLGLRDAARLTDNKGKNIQVNLKEVQGLLDEYVRRTTSPVATTLGFEEAAAFGIRDEGIMIATFLDILAEREGLKARRTFQPMFEDEDEL